MRFINPLCVRISGLKRTYSSKTFEVHYKMRGVTYKSTVIIVIIIMDSYSEKKYHASLLDYDAPIVDEKSLL